MKGSRIIFVIAAIAVAAITSVALASDRAATYAARCWQRTQSWFVDRLDWLVSKISSADANHLAAPKVALLGPCR